MTASAVWTPPTTLPAGTLVDADLLNAFVRDNFTWLKERVFSSGSTGSVSTSSTSWVEMTNSSVSITTTGGYILFWACGWASHTTGGASNFGFFDLAIDNVRQSPLTGLGTTFVQPPAANYGKNFNLLMLTGGGVGGSLLAAGVHTCSIHWYVSTGTATASLKIYAFEIC